MRNPEWYCEDCDQSGEVEVIKGEFPEDDTWEWPDTCPHCGEGILENDAIPDKREDFHSDG